MNISIDYFAIKWMSFDVVVVPLTSSRKHSNMLEKYFFDNSGVCFNEEVLQLKGLMPSYCAIVNSYIPRFKKIILVKEPVLRPNVEHMLNALHNTYMSCFKKAYIFGMKSIAIPIFGLDSEYYAKRDVIKTFVRAVNTLKKINGVDLDIKPLCSLKQCNKYRDLFEQLKFNIDFAPEEGLPAPILTPHTIDQFENIIIEEKVRTLPGWIRYYQHKKNLKLADCYRGVMSKTNFFKLMSGLIETDKYRLIAIAVQMKLSVDETNNLLSATGEMIDLTGQNIKDSIIIGGLNNHFTIEQINKDLIWNDCAPLPYSKP